MIISTAKKKDIVTGVVQRYVGENVSVSLDDKNRCSVNEI